MPNERPDRDKLIEKAKENPEEFVDLFLALWDRCEKLERRLSELERNSRNSSKPPSSDRGNLSSQPKPKPKSQRKGSKRKRGGQPGHKGNTLKQVEHPDHVVEHRFDSQSRCSKCGAPLSESGCDRQCEPEKRQVFELPAIRLEVTEHRAERTVCAACETLNTATFPQGVNAPAQYGPNLRATAIYLGSYQLVPYRRLGEIFADLFECPISEGTLANFVKEGGRQAVRAMQTVRSLIKQSDTMHCDETGCRLHGQRNWLHVASTKIYTCFMIHAKRGFEALETMGLLVGYTGKIVHDFWSSYYRYAECEHFLCNAHLLRDLTYLHEEMDQAWAKDMIELLLEAKKLRDCEKDRPPDSPPIIGEETRDRIQTRYMEIVAAGYATNPEPELVPGKRGKPGRGKILNLLTRLEWRYEEIMGFFEYDNVPFDNNQAERDLRMMKTREKISGTFRSDEHAAAFCDIRSIISTLKKQGLGVMAGIAEMLRNPGQMFADQVKGAE